MSKRITTKELHEEILGLREILEAILNSLDVDEKVKVKVEDEPQTQMCPDHPGETMFLQTKGKYGPFWTHGKQIGEGRWINCHGDGRGYRMNKAE